MINIFVSIGIILLLLLFVAILSCVDNHRDNIQSARGVLGVSPYNNLKLEERDLSESARGVQGVSPYNNLKPEERDLSESGGRDNETAVNDFAGDRRPTHNENRNENFVSIETAVNEFAGDRRRTHNENRNENFVSIEKAVKEFAGDRRPM